MVVNLIYGVCRCLKGVLMRAYRTVNSLNVRAININISNCSTMNVQSCICQN